MSDEALDSLRAEFADVDRSAVELRERSREIALELAGRGSEPPVDNRED